MWNYTEGYIFTTNRNSSIFLAGGFDSYISQPGCVTERNIVYAHIRQEEYNWHDSRQVGNLSWATLTVDISYALCVICNINVLHTCYEWDFFLPPMLPSFPSYSGTWDPVLLAGLTQTGSWFHPNFNYFKGQCVVAFYYASCCFRSKNRVFHLK